MATMMAAAMTPADFAKTFEANFNALDPAALASTYPADAVLNLRGGGNTFCGPEAIKAALANFMAAQLPMKTTPKVVLHSGPLAVVFFNWVIDGTGPDGTHVHMQGSSATDVLRLETGGTWRCVLDHPFGSATAAAAAAE